MGIFDAVSEFFGTKNEEKATPFQNTSNYNPNAFQYGGQAGVADQTAAGYGLMGRQAQARGGVGINAVQADYSRGGMDKAAGLMMARAQGTVPSIAGMQAQQDMQRAVAAQASAAAGARGPAALALAQQNAAANTANAQSAISGQAQIATAQERLAAEQAAFGAYGGMRQGDEQRALANAQLADAQRARNDAFQMGMTQNEMAVRNAQLQAQMAGQGLMAGSQQGAAGINAQVAGQNAGMNSRLLGGTIGLVEDGLGALKPPGGGGGTTSDARAKMGAQPIGGGGFMLSDVTSKVGLAQLGGPNQVPMGGAAPASFDSLSGGGMDVGGSLRAHSNFATQYQRDPSGGMMVSDDRAKVRDAERQAYLLGRAHGVERNPEFAYGGAPKSGEEIVDRDPWQSDARRAEQRPEWLEGYMHEQGGQSSRAGLAMGLDPLSDRAGGMMRRGTGVEDAPQFQSRAGDFYAGQPAMSEMTGQLARGLQPYAYEYKPGFGTEGQKVGPMAQEMAANDVTSTAVRKDPQTGLLAIDRDDGLKVALGGVGHLAQKQAQQEQLIAELLADRQRPSRRY
jgi:hypothetical protein